MPNVEQIRSIWTIVELVVEEAVSAAEQVQGLTTPEAKRSFIEDKAMAYLQEAENKYNFMPAPVAAIVFHGVKFALDLIINRVLAAKAAAPTVKPA